MHAHFMHKRECTYVCIFTHMEKYAYMQSNKYFNVKDYLYRISPWHFDESIVVGVTDIIGIVSMIFQYVLVYQLVIIFVNTYTYGHILLY